MDINDSFYGISASDSMFDGAASLALQAALQSSFSSSQTNSFLSSLETNIHPAFPNINISSASNTTYIDSDSRHVMHSTKIADNDSLESFEISGQKSFDSNNTSNPEDKENAFFNDRKY